MFGFSSGTASPLSGWTERPEEQGESSSSFYQGPGRTTQRKPMCAVEVSTVSLWRAAGR
jgi:hypothetical protein